MVVDESVVDEPERCPYCGAIMKELVVSRRVRRSFRLPRGWKIRFHVCTNPWCPSNRYLHVGSALAPRWLSVSSALAER